MSMQTPSLRELAAALASGGPQAQMAAINLASAQRAQERMAELVLDAARAANDEPRRNPSQAEADLQQRREAAARARGGVDVRA